MTLIANTRAVSALRGSIVVQRGVPQSPAEPSPLTGKLLIIGVGAALIGLIAICGGPSEDKSTKDSSEISPAAAPAPRVEPAPEPEPAKPKPELAIAIKASSLWANYEANEVRADETFKGKRLEVSGKIETIGKDILDAPYITLATGKEFTFGGVQAFFEGDATKQLAALSKGQAVVVRCKGAGRLGNVLLRECTLR